MLAVTVLVVLSYVVWLFSAGIENKPVIKIGVLHSLSGTMAASETPLVDAVRLAVEEANQSGGVNGAQIEMVVSGLPFGCGLLCATGRATDHA